MAMSPYEAIRFAQLEQAFGWLKEKVMSLDSKIDAVDAQVSSIGDSLLGITNDIQMLKDEVAAGNPVTEAKLDALIAKVTGVANAAKTLDDSTTQQTPVPPSPENP